MLGVRTVSTSDDLPWVLAALLASLNCSEQARIAYTFQVEVPRELLRESSSLKARGEWYHALPVRRRRIHSFMLLAERGSTGREITFMQAQARHADSVGDIANLNEKT